MSIIFYGRTELEKSVVLNNYHFNYQTYGFFSRSFPEKEILKIFRVQEAHRVYVLFLQKSHFQNKAIMTRISD